jgi:hypothetical protein
MGIFGENVANQLEEVKEYLSLQYDLFKIDVSEKLIVIITFFITLISVLIVVFAILLFLAFSIAFYLGTLWQNLWLGFLTISLVYMIIGGLLLVFRKPLILQPILRFILKVIYNDNGVKRK